MQHLEHFYIIWRLVLILKLVFSENEGAQQMSCITHVDATHQWWWLFGPPSTVKRFGCLESSLGDKLLGPSY